MAILSIIETPDPRLRVISKPVETFDAELKQLVADMFETMYDAPGIGLAAIQVAVPKRILVIDLQEIDPEDEEGKRIIRTPRVFINPVSPTRARNIASIRKAVCRSPNNMPM